jgi:hypothetical protein
MTTIYLLLFTCTVQYNDIFGRSVQKSGVLQRLIRTVPFRVDLEPNLGQSTVNDVSMQGILENISLSFLQNLVSECCPLPPRHVLLFVIHPLFLYCILK